MQFADVDRSEYQDDLPDPMAPSKDETLTPIRIRGKRRGTAAEKWHHGKRRKPDLQKRPTPPERASSATSQNSTVRPRERKRIETGDGSRLEQLPTEVIQLIFEHSANIELPLTSRTLASKLSKSQHLQHQLASEVLQPVLGKDAIPTKAELGRATRLLNSKFVTWHFFTAWLRTHANTDTPLNSTPNESADGFGGWIRLWTSLEPAPGLLPPKKLLCPSTGFSKDAIDFLTVLAHGSEHLPMMDAAYGELAYDGLIKAIQEGCVEVVSLMLKMGIHVSTETLRVAVAECGCHKDIVRMLLSHHPGHNGQSQASQSLCSEGALDLLDPEIWAWADKAQRQGNEKGGWLVAELRSTQQRRDTFET